MMPRPFSLIGSEDQWRRVAYDGTALVGDVVQLSWSEPEATDAPGSDPPDPAGLAFDEYCRLYHSVPEQRRVERLLWAAPQAPAPIDVIESPKPSPLGEFQARPGSTSAPAAPTALAVDQNGRLYVADPVAGTITVFDLWSRRQVEVLGIRRPLDLAMHKGKVVVLLDEPPALARPEGRGEVVATPLESIEHPSRLAMDTAGNAIVLTRAGTAGAEIHIPGQPVLAVERATDIEFSDETTLVVARLPGEDFLRFRVSDAAVGQISALKARGYDGRGIVATPDGRIGYWTEPGFRHAVAARVRYVKSGRVTGFRLDSGKFQNVWGRVFIDACIPKGTRVRMHCVAIDEPPPGDTLARTLPANVVSMEVMRPDLSPPMPPLELVPSPAEVTQTLHRRDDGRELPWAPPDEESKFETYEAPIITTAGRYLWITLDLSGDSVHTPRVKSFRAEHDSHDYLRRLPKLYSRELVVADFLRRYLAMFDGKLAELDGESTSRHALLYPQGAPAELLPWLASFVGLVLDERWPEVARRQMIEEAVWLFRFRGTIAGLTRFLEIYLGRERSAIVIEKYRVRGLGGAIVGADAGIQANSVLGAGFRIGGAVGVTESQQLGGAIEDAFDTHAHRFVVVIPMALTSEQSDVIQHILDVHRPAHTLVDVCTVGAGMRVGRGLHVNLTSIVGPTGGFRTLQLDYSLLGTDGIVGRPRPGITPAASRLGKDTRVG